MKSMLENAKRGLPFNDILIIDIHNHIGAFSQFNIPANSAEGMLVSMDTLGIDKAFITPHVAAIGADFKYGNDMVIETVRKYPERFIGYVTINPSYVEEIKDEIERCFSVKGIKGIKLHPSSHGCPIDHKNYQTVYEIADEKRYPILIHVWGKDEVAIINRLAPKYPGAQFIMGHGGAEARAMEDASEVINRHNNAYVDTAISMAPQGNIEWFVKESGSKKILFGTDMPFYDPRHTFGRVAMADISDDEKRDIFGLNAKRLLNI